MGIPFIVFTILAGIVLRLGLRWSFRRVMLVAVLVGFLADALTDLMLPRSR